MIYEIGIQYTRFSRDRAIRQAFMNVLAPPDLDQMSKESLIDWALDHVRLKYPDDLLMIDNINRDGPVTEIFDLEA